MRGGPAWEEAGALWGWQGSDGVREGAGVLPEVTWRHGPRRSFLTLASEVGGDWRRLARIRGGSVKQDRKR